MKLMREKMALLLIDNDILRELLQLPSEVEILDVQSDILRRGTLTIKVRGAGWEQNPEHFLRVVHGTVTKDSKGRHKIIWGFLWRSPHSAIVQPPFCVVLQIGRAPRYSCHVRRLLWDTLQ